MKRRLFPNLTGTGLTAGKEIRWWITRRTDFRIRLLLRDGFGDPSYKMTHVIFYRP